MMRLWIICFCCLNMAVVTCTSLHTLVSESCSADRCVTLYRYRKEVAVPWQPALSACKDLNKTILSVYDSTVQQTARTGLNKAVTVNSDVSQAWIGGRRYTDEQWRRLNLTVYTGTDIVSTQNDNCLSIRRENENYTTTTESCSTGDSNIRVICVTDSSRGIYIGISVAGDVFIIAIFVIIIIVMRKRCPPREKPSSRDHEYVNMSADVNSASPEHRQHPEHTISKQPNQPAATPGTATNPDHVTDLPPSPATNGENNSHVTPCNPGPVTYQAYRPDRSTNTPGVTEYEAYKPSVHPDVHGEAPYEAMM